MIHQMLALQIEGHHDTCRDAVQLEQEMTSRGQLRFCHIVKPVGPFGATWRAWRDGVIISSLSVCGDEGKSLGRLPMKTTFWSDAIGRLGIRTMVGLTVDVTPPRPSNLFFRKDKPSFYFGVLVLSYYNMHRHMYIK